MKSNSQRIKLWRKKSGRAFSLFELLVVILIVFVAGLLACLYLPSFRRAKERAQRITCAGQLMHVGLDFKIWAGDHNDKYPMQVSVTGTNGGAMELATNGILFLIFEVMSNELVSPKVLICPADKNRFAAIDFKHGSNSNISYFVGIDADEPLPGMLLSGDRNITNGTAIRNGILELTTNHVTGWTDEIHGRCGNILLVDGSVQQVTSGKLNFLPQNSGVITNRLLIP